ncbi:MAG: 16S rRNA (cytidine(1402)-2'-O)-methyltransferase [Oscillospiraceae bacterium]|nr:16S rRNA (cytidine(1402)-2'-O)-methyltransferase [Oscillospiraceae bacterium]
MKNLENQPTPLPTDPSLFIVGTPIGNLGDFSQRGIEVLKSVDFIAAEDTRVTAKLLARFDIRKPLVSYHEHNLRESGGKIISRLLAGERCALVSDAGMPAISDPGEVLVREARMAGIKVAAIPGPVAFATALALCGMPCKRFCFEGFLSTNTSARRKHLAEISDEKRTLIFYEAPHKLPYTLRDLYEVLGERDIAMCRELTKIHEEVFCTTLSQAIALCGEKKPRGEYVLIVSGAPEKAPEVWTLERALEFAREEMWQGFSAPAAAKSAAKVSGVSRSEIYRQLVSGKG